METPDTLGAISWHALSIDETFAKLESSLLGLTFAQAEKRRKIFGLNQLPFAKPPSLWMRFIRQFNNALIYTLLASAAIALFFKSVVDASVILSVVVLNAIFGCIQEGKAEAALQSIRNRVAAKAHVLRDGKPHSIASSALVPGDIVLLQSGDKIPADLRLIEVNNLQVQESTLTGESLPVEKEVFAVPNDAHLTDRTSMVYCGTIVNSGRGQGVVVATGSNSEMGHISKELIKGPPVVTPLIKNINAFGHWLILGIIVAAAATFIIGLFLRNESAASLLIAVVTIIVAAIPEGLPAIVTIILAIGATRMAKKHAIVRRLSAVETMGAVTTVCTDKTGTLTRNELAVCSVITSAHRYDIKIDGQAIFSIDQEIIDFHQYSDLFDAMHASLLCNEAVLTHGENGWYLHGDPLDGALLSLGIKAKIDIALTHRSFPHTSVIPFDQKRKLMAALHHDESGNGFIYIKGAPEQILKLCSWQKVAERTELIDVDYWHAEINAMAKKGERVVAVAFRPASSSLKLHLNDIKEGFIFLALFGFLDLPREESKGAISKCYAAQIDVKMVTGDHVLTAINIAKQVGIKNPENVLIGKDLEKLSIDELSELVNKINVYARTSPEDKLRLVQALKKSGHVVAMTGDGVNDIPALLQADIGIAMGRKGSDAAKDAAALVLTDDNFATIADAIEAGRTIYDNLKKAIIYILPTSIAQALVIMVAILFGSILPISPVQVLWVNMITAITLSLALAFEPTEEAIMQKPPRPVKEPLLTPLLFWRTIFVSVLITVAAFLLFLSESDLTKLSLSTIRTIVVNMIVISEAFYLFNCRKIYSSSLNIKTIFGSKPALLAIIIVILLQLAFTYFNFMQRIFGTTDISLRHWMEVIGLSLAIFLLVEIEKRMMRFCNPSAS